MFKLIKIDGTELGLVDKVHYIRLHENGCFVETDEKNAQGIAFQSTSYNLHGCEQMAGVSETVLPPKEENGGEYVFKHDGLVSALASAVVDLECRTILMEWGIA